MESVVAGEGWVKPLTQPSPLILASSPWPALAEEFRQPGAGQHPPSIQRLGCVVGLSPQGTVFSLSSKGALLSFTCAVTWEPPRSPRGPQPILHPLASSDPFSHCYFFPLIPGGCWEPPPAPSEALESAVRAGGLFVTGDEVQSQWERMSGEDVFKSKLCFCDSPVLVPRP